MSEIGQRIAHAIRENVGTEVWAQDASHPVSAPNIVGIETATIAAIKAMREPTVAMVKAGDAKETIMATLSDDCSDGLGVWQAMIDELLKDMTNGKTTA